MKLMRTTLILGIFWGMAAPAKAQIDANWTGGDGDYSDAGNWSTSPDVPCNDGDTYNVAIGSSGTDVLLDVPSCTVQSLLLGSGTTFKINLGNTYTTLGEALLGGSIYVDSGSFTAPAPNTGFTGSTSRVTAGSGAQIVIPATTYDGTGISGGTVFSADGVGTRLDLSSLTSINCRHDYGGSPVRTISATDSGHIDLSSLESVQGGWAVNNDRLDFVMSSGGSIDLTGLQSVTGGYVRFAVDDALFTLPALTSAVGMVFSMAPASTLNLSVLLTHDTGGYDVPAQGVINADVLNSLTNASLAIGDGGTFHAPNLATFSGSTLTLGPDQTLDVPPFTDIDDARIYLSGSATYAVAAGTCDVTGISSGLIYSADGAGTILDLAQLTILDNTYNYGGTPVRTISATADGHIDLSGLVSVQGGSAVGDDRLDFATSSGGTIALTGLQSVTGGSVQFASDAPTFTLVALESAVGMTFSMAPDSVVNLPVLLTHHTGGYDVPVLGTVNADELHSLTGASLEIGEGGTFNAPFLTNFNGSTLTLGPDQTLNTAAFTEVDQGRILLSGGATFAVAASTCDLTGISAGLIYSADGAGTVLDLSQLTSIDNKYNYGGTPVRTISATNGGHIDLSGLESVQGGWAVNDDRLDFAMNSGGTIDLTSLRSVTGGYVRFASEAPTFALPALESAVGMDFNMAPGSILNLPALLTHSTGGYSVPTQGTVNAGSLASLTSATLEIGDEGTFNAPFLTEFSGSTLTLGANQTLNAPAFTELDNARIHLSGGQTYAVAASAYDGTGISSGAIFSATGAGTLLDLSSLTSIDSVYNYGGSPVRTIWASDNGTIDLAGLQTLQGGWVFNDDRLELVAESGGAIDLSTLPAVAAGHLRFRVESAGQLLAGGMLTVENVQTILVDGIGSLLDLSSVTGISGSGTASVSISNGASLLADDLELVDDLVFSLGGPSMLALAGTTTMTGTTFNYNGGTISGDVILVDSVLNNGPGGTGAASFTLQGDGLFSGDIALGQSVLVQGGGFGSANVIAAGGFVNSGVLTLESINGGLSSNLILSTGVLENAAGGVIRINAGTGGDRTLEAEFVNRGTFDITTSDNKGITVGRTGANHTTSGSFIINATELDTVVVSGDSFTNLPGGIVAGVGSLTMLGSGLTSEGIVRPGLSTGWLDIVGEYVQTAGATLEIEIGGPASGDSFDVLAVTGSAWLAGALNVTLVDGYSPAINESYAVVVAGALSGSFDTVAFPELPAGLCWDVSYDATTVTLTVLGSAIIQQPADQTVCEWDPVAFSVAVGGNLPVSYQWRKDGTDLPGEEGDSLSIDSVTLGDAGTYEAVVTNVCGTITSGAARLTIHVAPAVTLDPISQEICEGDPVTFTASATGTPAPDYKWRKGGVDLPGKTTDTLTIDAVAPADAGDYDVVVTNDCGSETSFAATLTSHVAPAVTLDPISQEICEGDPMTFTVSATGSPAPDYKWRKDGLDLPGETADTLIIDAVAPADAGEYEAVISNGCGEVVSDAAILTLAVSPPGDIDANCVVDLSDVALFIACLTGPDGGVPAECAAADLDGDAAGIDARDFARLQTGFGVGP